MGCQAQTNKKRIWLIYNNNKITKQTFHFQTSSWQASVSTWAQVKPTEGFQITCFIKQISAIEKWRVPLPHSLTDLLEQNQILSFINKMT